MLGPVGLPEFRERSPATRLTVARATDFHLVFHKFSTPRAKRLISASFGRKIFAVPWTWQSFPTFPFPEFFRASRGSRGSGNSGNLKNFCPRLTCSKRRLYELAHLYPSGFERPYDCGHLHPSGIRAYDCFWSAGDCQLRPRLLLHARGVPGPHGGDAPRAHLLVGTARVLPGHFSSRRRIGNPGNPAADAVGPGVHPQSHLHPRVRPSRRRRS